MICLLEQQLCILKLCFQGSGWEVSVLHTDRKQRKYFDFLYFYIYLLLFLYFAPLFWPMSFLPSYFLSYAAGERSDRMAWWTPAVCGFYLHVRIWIIRKGSDDNLMHCSYCNLFYRLRTFYQSLIHFAEHKNLFKILYRILKCWKIIWGAIRFNRSVWLRKTVTADKRNKMCQGQWMPTGKYEQVLQD